MLAALAARVRGSIAAECHREGLRPGAPLDGKPQPSSPSHQTLVSVKKVTSG
jgi:hypothetical protein